jgi:hypothetical protein
MTALRTVSVRRSYPSGAWLAQAEARDLAEAEMHLAWVGDDPEAWGVGTLERRTARWSTERIAATMLVDWFKTGQRPTETSGEQWTHCSET